MIGQAELDPTVSPTRARPTTRRRLDVRQRPLALGPDEILKGIYFTLKALYHHSQATILNFFKATPEGRSESAIVAQSASLSCFGIEAVPQVPSDGSKVALECPDVVEFVRD